MKFFNRLLLLAALFSVVACNKDDDTNAGGDDDIVGVWDLNVLDYTGKSTTTVSGMPFTADFMGSARDITASVEFKSDGTYQSMGTYTIDLTTSLNGQNFTQAVTITDWLGTGTYMVNGNVITATDSQAQMPQSIDITKLDGDDLEMDFTFTQSSNQQGVISTTSIDGNYSFKRR
ncbi:MAG: hypothetical protein AAF990_24800 [Bacteroidota bacterium]